MVLRALDYYKQNCDLPVGLTDNPQADCETQTQVLARS